MFAVIRTGGKQYKVRQDDKISVESLEAEAGSEVDLDVLLVSDGSDTQVRSADVGALSAKVTAMVVEHIRAPKVTIFKKKRRQNYRRKRGHRQNLTVLRITGIQAA